MTVKIHKAALLGHTSESGTKSNYSPVQAKIYSYNIRSLNKKLSTSKKYVEAKSHMTTLQHISVLHGLYMYKKT